MKRSLLFLMLLVAPFAHAQGGDKQLPITTGTPQTRMDAPEKNSELETYTHSPMVARLGRAMGLSTNQASRLFEDFNSGILIAVVLYYLLKIVPGKLRAKRDEIDRELAEARAATADSDRRLRAGGEEGQMRGGGVVARRRQAAQGSVEEEARIHAALEEEKARIVRQAEQEIAAAQSNAERGLKQYAADLAVERAAARVQLTPEGDRAVVDDFLRDLAGQLGKQGQN